MNQKLFAELLESVQQGSAILRGNMKPSRRFEMDPTDVRALRRQYDLTQRQFAELLGVSISTLRQWEHGRRQPGGPARVLLQIVTRHPNVLLSASAAS